MEVKDYTKEVRETVHQNVIFKDALRLAKPAITIAFFITPIRYMLELAGVNENYIFLIGLLWLTLGFAVYWGIKIYRYTQPYLVLLLSLAIFAPISRVPVFLAWWVDTTWDIGTHYGLYFDHWTQALGNQLGYGALVQIIPGFLLGAITLSIMQYRKR